MKQPDAIGAADGRMIVMIVSGLWLRRLGLAGVAPNFAVPRILVAAAAVLYCQREDRISYERNLAAC